MRNQINEYIIVGYSLEACVISRKMASLGHVVNFVPSGKLGYPYDEIGDSLNEWGMKKVIELVDINTKKMSNAFHVHVPYANLRMVNDNNGLINFPLNRLSFESAEEWEQIKNRVNTFDDFNKKIDDAVNYINIYKKFLPKWLFESLVKHLGINKWKLKQSQFTKESLLREVNLNHLGESKPKVVYKPVDGFQNLCSVLLDHKNIKIRNHPIGEIKELLRMRIRNSIVVYIDNRIDYICDYSMGKLDRVDLLTENVTDSEKSRMDEYACIDESSILTPYMDYWATVSSEGKTLKLFSEEVTKIGKFDQNLIVPSQSNLKMINEYTKLFKRYPNKDFILPAPLTILI